MKVLQISFTDYFGGGGASIAMHRLCCGLENLNVDISILSKGKTLGQYETEIVPRSRILEFAIKQITKPFGLNDIHTIGSFKISGHPFFQAADLLNLHIIHGDYFNYLALPFLTAKKPAVFTLHDMWGLTGHCSYSFDCSRWQTGCGNCPYPQTYPEVSRDSTQIEWLLKKWVYQKSNLSIVSPSRWLAEKARGSIMGHFDIACIPNGIDLDTFQSVDKRLARKSLDIPDDKYVLMCSADSLQDERKGGDLLIESLGRLPPNIQENSVLLLMGNKPEIIRHEVKFPVYSLGFVSSERLKVLAYSSADLFIFPTRADNLPLVLQESMACGTPMVSFDVGGVSELVRPNQTGMLASKEDAQDFSDKISLMLQSNERWQEMSQNCRNVAVSEYSLELQAQRYFSLYETLTTKVRHRSEN
jgi:glycosyltransferase involved in cell wall biosynthesis